MATAVTLSVHILSQYPVVTWGTDAQRARWLPAMLAGEALGAFALTEPQAGSDAAAIRTRAERVGAGGCPDGVPADRHEDLDLERARGGPLPGLRHARSGGGHQGHHRVPRREGDDRLPVRRARAEDGDPRLPGRGAGLRGLRGPGREPPRRRGRRLPDRAVGARRGPHLDRGCVRRDRAGRRSSRPQATCTQRQAFGGAAGRPAGRPVHARRDGPGGRGGARADVARRPSEGPRRAARRGVVARPSGPRPTRRCASPPTPCSCSARAATRARRASSG